MKLGDDKGLSKELEKKQKTKGTYDSPCMSICDYEGHNEECATCFLRKNEKVSWKVADEKIKQNILNNIRKRIS